jgi:hypothetical protein
LPGAALIIHDEKKGTITDAQGRFRIEGLCLKTYTIDIHFLGYKELAIDVTMDGTVERQIVLEEELKKHDEVIVTGKTENVDHVQN